MQTRYSAVIKIRSQSVEDLQLRLVRLDASISSVKRTNEKLKESLFELSLPSSGVFSKAVALHELSFAYRSEIAQNDAYLQQLSLARNSLLYELTQARQELERMEYLHNEEIKQIVLKKKRLEASQMDEIGMMLFNNGRAEQ